MIDCKPDIVVELLHEGLLWENIPSVGSSGLLPACQSAVPKQSLALAVKSSSAFLYPWMYGRNTVLPCFPSVVWIL